MKKIAFLLTLLTLILTPCCNRTSQYERILADIDSLIGTDADSARNMLLRMDGDMKDANEDTRAYYNLLLVKADEWAKKEHGHSSERERSLIAKIIQVISIVKTKALNVKTMPLNV